MTARRAGRRQAATTVIVNQEQVAQEALRKACWIVDTYVLDTAALSDQQLVTALLLRYSDEYNRQFE